MPDFPTTPVNGDTHVIATSTWEYYSSTDRWEIQDTSGGSGGGGGGGGSNAWGDITGTPTTITGYGITDAFDGSYMSLTSVPSTPNVLTDLAISDGTNGQVLTTDGSGGFTFTTVSSGGGGSNAWGDITGTPTTITGYGITDAVTSSSATVFTNKSGAISQWTNDAGYITTAGITSNVVSDTTPQLGGDLDGQNHTITNVTIGDSTEFHGNILLTGTATSTEASRTIDFTGFDKEGTTDFTDRAYIRHTVGVGGHANTVLEISSLNDADDGIAFTTHANSLLRHNGNAIYSEGHKPSFSEIAFTPTTIAGYGITDGGGATTLTDLGIADGTNGQVLTTDGSAGFTFTTVSSGGGGSTAWGDITGTPTTITGYGITDAFNGVFSSLTGKPTTIAGYGITDADASTALGAVGTYAQMQNNSGTANIAAGSTIAGSDLLYHNLNYAILGSPAASGTWRVMGRYLSSGTGSLNGISVCVRIS